MWWCRPAWVWDSAVYSPGATRWVCARGVLERDFIFDSLNLSEVGAALLVGQLRAVAAQPAQLLARMVVILGLLRVQLEYLLGAALWRAFLDDGSLVCCG